jgi:hypothetical protein
LNLLSEGIVGLTTALEIQAKGNRVTIFADCIPGDEKSTRYTSPWAVRPDALSCSGDAVNIILFRQGAHHLMVMGDDPKKRGLFDSKDDAKINNIYTTYIEYERQTFNRLWAESGKDSNEAQCIMQSLQKEFYEEDVTGKTELDHMPEASI